MNKEELIGKLQMVYVGDINALNELIGYYDGLKQGIEELQQENKILRENAENNDKVVDKVNWENMLLKKENEQLKDVINKINNYISNYDVFKVFSFPLMKRWEEEQVKSSIDYEFKTSLIKDIKDILKEVSE